MAKRLVVFAPHPDDETLGCGGTILCRTHEGYEASVVVMTDGRHALSKGFGIFSNPSPEELKNIRRTEVERAASILGVSGPDLIFLDFEDGMLKENMKTAELRVRNILEENPPNEVFFPTEKELSLDHQATNRIIKSSLKLTGTLTIEYQYSITQRHNWIDPIADRFAALLKHNLIEIDISNFLPLKKAALKEYKSQLDILSEKQETPVITARYLKKFIRDKERFVVDKKQFKLRS